LRALVYICIVISISTLSRALNAPGTGSAAASPFLFLMLEP
jgi:hypothetical protein